MAIDKSLILNKLRDYYGFKTDTEFAVFLGIAQPTLSNWHKRRTLDYELIISKCDNINANWLLRGDPPMFLDKRAVNQVAEEGAQYKDVRIEELKSALKDKDEIIKFQREEIARLKATDKSYNVTKRAAKL